MFAESDNRAATDMARDLRRGGERGTTSPGNRWRVVWLCACWTYVDMLGDV